MSTATRLYRSDEHARITVLEKSGHVSFATCSLPYYIGGVIEGHEKLLLQTPASLHERFRLDVHVNTEVNAIDREAHALDVTDLTTGASRRIRYDRPVLSPGASPPWNCPSPVSDASCHCAPWRTPTESTTPSPG